MSTVVNTSLSASGTPASAEGSCSPAATAASTATAADSAADRGDRAAAALADLVAKHAASHGADDGAGPRRWIIDPIDGTKSYVRGIPTWTTLIGLSVDDEVTVGVVSMPALNKRWWASHGNGAFADGRRIHVSGVDALADSQMAWSGIEDWDAVGRLDAIVALGRACWRTRGIGDSWQYMLVAEGSAEIALDPEVSVWDLAAIMIVIEEAGGRFTDLAGARTPAGGSGIATNGLVHEAALGFVGR